MIQSWDCAFKETDSSDYVVGQVWGRIGADKYLLDQARRRMDCPTTIEAVRTMSDKWPQAQAKLIEVPVSAAVISAVCSCDLIDRRAATCKAVRFRWRLCRFVILRDRFALLVQPEGRRRWCSSA